MVYTLPTIASLNRQSVVTNRRRFPHHEPPSSVCPHRDIRRFAGGRCPACYRQSLRSYGRRQRQRNSRRARPAPVVRLPPINPSEYFGNLLVHLPGVRVYGSARDSCSICMNTYESDRTCQQLPCNHRFHAWCYQKWYIKKRNCPLCRANF